MTKVYIDQIAELAAESVKAASLTPLRARESAPLSHREAGRRENEIIETQAKISSSDLLLRGLQKSFGTYPYGGSFEPCPVSQLGNLRGPVPKPSPPSDHAPLRRRCAE